MKNINYLRLLLSFVLLGIIAFISLVIVVGDEEAGFEPGLFANKVLPVVKVIFNAIVLPAKIFDKLFNTFQPWWALGLRVTIGCVLYSILIELIIMGVKALDKKNPLSF